MTVFVAADNMITSLGFSTEENVENFKKGISGIKPHNESERLGPSCCISLVDTQPLEQAFEKIANPGRYTRLEKMAILSIKTALKSTDLDVADDKTLFIFSTTKGNIDLLTNRNHKFKKDRIQLWKTAQVISSFFNNPNPPLVVSNACISGILALNTAARLLEISRYKAVVVVGGDIATEFVIAGFQSFKAVSANPCKPYDENRDGLSLGEGCGTIILTNYKTDLKGDQVVVRGGACSNDANHISGPSRTGEGLLLALQNTLKQANENPQHIDFISAHGTATRFNDDMESMTLDRASMNLTPVNSMKGYFGHTLGAAGILESVIAVRSIRHGFLLPTKGLNKKGTVRNINVIEDLTDTIVDHSLKLASGFGGCNGAILFSKDGTF